MLDDAFDGGNEHRLAIIYDSILAFEKYPVCDDMPDVMMPRS
jgi:hypothetical protein